MGEIVILDQLINDMYNQKIEIKSIQNKMHIILPDGLVLPEDMKQKIRRYRKSLIDRYEDNKTARELGFLVYGQGELYEYRYGWGSYLSIERERGGVMATAWRANYREDESIPYRSITIARNVPFPKAYEKAAGFIEWMKNKRRS